MDSKPHKVQVNRKHKSDLQVERKPGKKHRVSSSQDEVNESHRGRWQSESILEEYAYEMEREGYQHGNRESSKEHKCSYCRHTREKDRERELERERERERDRGRERKREKAQYEEQKYEREREETGRRKRDRESRGPSREDRDRYNDRSSRQRRFDDLDDDGHAYHRRCETDNERDRTASLLKFEKQKTQETESEKPERYWQFYVFFFLIKEIVSVFSFLFL